MIPGVVAASHVRSSGGGGFATYADYAAYVGALTVAYSTTIASVGSFRLNPLVTGRNRITATDGYMALTGTMWGSPWASNRLSTNDSYLSRYLQHAVETTTATVNGAPNVYLLDIVVGSSFGFSSVTRNGYTSASYTSFSSQLTNRFVYWDYNLGKARSFDAVTQIYSDFTGY